MKPRLPPSATASHPTLAVTGGRARSDTPDLVTNRTLDRLAVEAPLEIVVQPEAGGGARPVAVTMRTPGDDLELVAGFLFSEGIIQAREDLRLLAPGGPDRVQVTLGPGLAEAISDRRFTVSSACGVCGKDSRDALEVLPPLPPPPLDAPAVDPKIVLQLPGALRRAQPCFDRTGGLHAAGLFSADGQLLLAREDVGRHNAVDKVVGHLLLEGLLPAHDRLLVVSGRASFELVQKCVLAGVPLLAAVGAPSTAAVDLATAHGVTLLGFLREERFNVYAGPQRLRLPDPGPGPAGMERPDHEGAA